MSLYETQQIATAAMQEHNLHDWSFAFDNARKRFGLTNHRTKVISISKHLAQLNEENHVKDTILHEVAHAIAGHGAGHGYHWRVVARRIGANPRRCYDSRVVETPNAPYIATCGTCGHVSKRFKKIKPGRQIACGYCCNKYNYGRFSNTYMLTFRKAGE